MPKHCTQCVAGILCAQVDNICHANAMCFDDPDTGIICECKEGYVGDGLVNCSSKSSVTI